MPKKMLAAAKAFAFPFLILAIITLGFAFRGKIAEILASKESLKTWIAEIGRAHV
jgi:hypothetical protein